MILKLQYIKSLCHLFTLTALFVFTGCSTAGDDEIIEEIYTKSAVNFASRSVGSVITIKAVNNRYLSSEDGTQNMTTNRVEAGNWEKFTVVDAGDGYIGLKASNDKFVCSESNGALPLIANRDNIGGDWEKFKFVPSGNKFAIISKKGKYVCAENGGNDSPIADRDEINSWEEFTIETVTNDDNTTPTSSGFDFGGAFKIETSDNCGGDTGTDTKDYVTLANNTYAEQGDLTFFENVNGSYILQSCNQDGTRTEWKQTTRFSLNDNRKMTYRAKFYDYPTAGVTIAQVHNRGGAGRPLLRVEIADGEIHFVIVDTWVKNSGNSYTVIGPNYTSNTYLDLSLEVGNDQIKAIVSTTNGGKTVIFSKNNSDDNLNINDKWYETDIEKNDIDLDKGFYFKAGVYNDSGDDNNHPKGLFTSFDYTE